MTNSNLMLHSGAQRVDRNTLRMLPDPIASSARHYPIKHIDLIEGLEQACEDYDLTVVNEEFGITPAGDRIFGTFDIVRDDDPDGGNTILGFRQGNAGKGPSLGVCGGRRTFVCDNMCFSGDLFTNSAIHTTNLQLIPFLEESIEGFLDDRKAMLRIMEKAQEKNLSAGTARALLNMAFQFKVLPGSVRGTVNQAYFDRDLHPESGVYGETLWDLNQAMTYGLNAIPMEKRFQRTIEVGRLVREAVTL